MSQEIETTLAVQGMTCSHCVRAINQALHGLPGVTGVDVCLADKTVKVRHDDHAAPVPKLVDALKDAGYEAH